MRGSDSFNMSTNLNHFQKMIGRIKYDQLEEGLRQAKTWLNSLSINTAGTRFDKIVRNIVAINKAYKNNTIDKFAQNVDLNSFGLLLFNRSTRFCFSLENVFTASIWKHTKKENQGRIAGPFFSKRRN